MSWVGVSYLDGDKVVNELHTIRETGLTEVNGFKVIKYNDEEALVNGVAKNMRNNKVYFILGHNIPHDFKYLKNVKAADFIINEKVEREPGFKVSKGNFYKRLFAEGQEIIDTHRAARIFMPYSDGFSLEKVVNCLGYDFEKELNYDEMRKLEILSINGDVGSAREIAEYATRDIEPLRQITEGLNLFEKLFIVKKNLPYLSLTEISFSANSARVALDYEYFKKHKSQRNSSAIARDFVLELKDGKELFDKLRRKKLIDKDISIKKSYLGNKYYFSLESLVATSIKTVDLSDFISSGDIGMVQYAKAIVNEALFFYALYDNQKDKYYKALRSVGLNKTNSLETVKTVEKLHSGDLNSFERVYNDVVNIYRSFIYSLEEKNEIGGAFGENEVFTGQLDIFDKRNLFEKEDSKYFKLFDLNSDLKDRLSEGSRNIFNAFRANFAEVRNILRVVDKKANIHGRDFSLIDLFYVVSTRRRLVDYRKRFFSYYEVNPDSFNGSIPFESVLNDAFDQLENSLENVNVLGTNGTYFWIEGEIDSKFMIKV